MTENVQWITLVTTLVSMVAGFGYQIYTAKRDRRWDLEDRALVAKRMMRETRRARVQSNTHAAELSAAMAANTEISTKAFHEANSVNLKIEKLGVEHNALQRDEAVRERKEERKEEKNG